MSSLTRSASKFLSYSVGLFGFIVLSTSNLAAEDELDSSGQSDLEMDLAFVSLILFSWADVKGSTTVGTDDRDSPDDSQTALALDANVAIPLSRITGPQLS